MKEPDKAKVITTRQTALLLLSQLRELDADTNYNVHLPFYQLRFSADAIVETLIAYEMKTEQGSK